MAISDQLGFWANMEELCLRPVRAFLKICSKPRNFKMDRLTVGWNLSPPLYGPKAELNCTRYPRLTCNWPLSSSQHTRNWITRSGIAATLRAVRYSGFFLKREEFSRVETSSGMGVSQVSCGPISERCANLCKLAQTRARREGWTCSLYCVPDLMQVRSIEEC